jgi:hypothetical protein
MNALFPFSFLFIIYNRINKQKEIFIYTCIREPQFLNYKRSSKQDKSLSPILRPKYTLRFKYVSRSDKILKEWDVAISSKSKKAQQYFLETKKTMSNSKNLYLSFGFNVAELLKIEEQYFFCTYSTKSTSLDYYCTNTYSENDVVDENICNLPNVDSLFKLPSPKPNTMTEQNRVSIFKENNGKEYFDIVRDRYHNIEF